MKDLIVARVENYKKHRQDWVDKQYAYKWSKKELDMGSETYGLYQEREQVFTTKILELEWVLSLIKE